MVLLQLPVLRGYLNASKSLLLILRAEVNRYTIHAVSLIFRVTKSFALENVSKMPSAIVAYDFGPHHTQSRVRSLTYSVWERIPKGRPAAPGIKLVVCFI